MGHSGRNQDFLARFGPDTPAPEFQFQPALDRHHQLVGRVAVILPHLTGRINPKITTEAPRLPLLGDCLLIDDNAANIAGVVAGGSNVTIMGMADDRYLRANSVWSGSTTTVTGS